MLDGRLRLKQKIRLWSNGQVFEVEALGYQAPKATPCDELAAGEVGFLSANIKTVSDAKIGDTILDAQYPNVDPLPGFEEIKPMVFAGLYPVESHEHGLLRDALDVVPVLEDAHVIEYRLGLRPTSPDLEPFFETLGASRWAWVSGHYRHGVTLAPLAASEALAFVKETS